MKTTLTCDPRCQDSSVQLLLQEAYGCRLELGQLMVSRPSKQYTGKYPNPNLNHPNQKPRVVTNYRQEEKKILDRILNKEVYDSRMRPRGINSTSKISI